MKIDISTAIQELNTLSTQLVEKANLFDSSLLTTDDDAVANLKQALQVAIDKLNKDIEELKNTAESANNNIKWK